jgi:myo-inositol 2-dehydrogenase/D-chiro-inositol 1-dehydrogenase
MPLHSIALIGAGRMGALHAVNIVANPRLALAAIADNSSATAEQLAARTDTAARSYEEILGDSAITGIVVASSTSSHFENVLAAVRARKAVFCEKPLSLDASALEMALPVLEAHAMPIFVGFNRRFDPHLCELKRRFDDGQIGRLESMHIVNHDPAPPRAEFIPRSGGLFKDFTIHDFDTAWWLGGKDFVDVFATGSCLIDQEIGEHGDIDTAKLVLRSASGALCVISNSRRTGYGYDQRVELFGSGGAIALDNVHVSEVRTATEAGEASSPFPYSFAERYADAYRAELDHFADVLDGMVEPATGPRDSLRALRLADAAERSMKNGCPIVLESVQ